MQNGVWRLGPTPPRELGPPRKPGLGTGADESVGDFLDAVASPAAEGMTCAGVYRVWGGLMARNLGGRKPDFGVASAIACQSKPFRPATVASLALIGLILAGCARSTTENASAIKRVSIFSSSSKHTSKQNSQPRISPPVSERASQSGISLPEPELLEHQAAPDCEFKSAAQADSEIARRAMKLDYEQQCYRQSEAILRARMERLQDAVGKTIESLKRRDRTSGSGAFMAPWGYRSAPRALSSLIDFREVRERFPT
jgi:hypothetical protein